MWPSNWRTLQALRLEIEAKRSTSGGRVSRARNVPTMSRSLPQVGSGPENEEIRERWQKSTRSRNRDHLREYRRIADIYQKKKPSPSEPSRRPSLQAQPADSQEDFGSYEEQDHLPDAVRLAEETVQLDLPTGLQEEPWPPTWRPWTMPRRSPLPGALPWGRTEIDVYEQQ